MSEGFGRDTSCFDELRTGRLVSGTDLLAEAIYRRLTTPRGTLRDGDEGLVYGLDLQGFVGTVGTQDAADALPDAVIAEVLKDDRVERCECSAAAQTGTDGLTTIILDVDVFPRDQTENFTLTLSVDDVTVELLGVSA